MAKPRWGFVNALSKAKQKMAKAISAKSRVTKYRAKRDFATTSEPAGKKAVSSSSTLRFVIQRHDARRLHYDLRLELDGVFKSWAVTRGPSLDPNDKRLAVEVEDHPLEYGDFEGTIPKGQYGGGTVQLWDRGYWIAEGDPHDGLKRVELKFSLEGERLKGGWVLVRMKNDRSDGKRTNWLLIKHRDDARAGDGDALLTDPKSIASGRSLDAIAAGKSKAPTSFITRKLSVSGAVVRSTSVKKPARYSTTVAMPRFIEPQLCKLVERATSEPGWGHEVKFDGYRMQLRVENNDAQLRTRKGIDWTAKFGDMAAAASALPDCLLDGEVVALDKHAEPDFAALQGALSEHNTDELIYFAFDLLFAGGEDLRELPLRDRKARLKPLFAKSSYLSVWARHAEWDASK
ncbi:MAG: DNA polymerase ligase N-terminal domain-containing protein [Desulfobacterales bacterium]